MSDARAPLSTTGIKIAAAFVAGAILGAISIVQIVPGTRTVSTAPGVQASGATPSSGSSSSPSPGAKGGKGTSPGASPSPGNPSFECAPGRNGGSTDIGVSGTSITMAPTVVQSGPGA